MADNYDDNTKDQLGRLLCERDRWLCVELVWNRDDDDQSLALTDTWSASTIVRFAIRVILLRNIVEVAR
jgi:hypothetical protein